MLRTCNARISNGWFFAHRRHIACVACLALLALAAGCGDGDDRVPVAGTVRHNDKPVPNLFIQLESDEHPPAWGETDDAGRFVLQGGEGDGIEPGKYRVWIDYRAGDPDPNAPASEDAFGPPAALHEILPKYTREATELTVQIAGPQDDLSIELE
jgi:hypothetical protein